MSRTMDLFFKVFRDAGRRQKLIHSLVHCAELLRTGSGVRRHRKKREDRERKSEFPHTYIIEEAS